MFSNMYHTYILYPCMCLLPLRSWLVSEAKSYLLWSRWCVSLHWGSRMPTSITSASTRSTPTPDTDSPRCTATNRSMQRRWLKNRNIDQYKYRLFNRVTDIFLKVLEDSGILDIRAVITFKGKVGQQEWSFSPKSWNLSFRPQTLVYHLYTIKDDNYPAVQSLRSQRVKCSLLKRWRMNCPGGGEIVLCPWEWV